MNEHIPYGGYIQECEEADLRQRAAALGNPILYPIRNQYQYCCAIEQAVEPDIRDQVNALFEAILQESREKTAREDELNEQTLLREKHLRLLRTHQ